MNSNTAKIFEKFLDFDIEVGGSLDYKLQITNIVYGDRWKVEFDQSTPYNFHSHPVDKTVLFSFYSVGDVIWAFRKALEFGGSVTRKIRKEFLITEDGIYSLSITPNALEFYSRYVEQADVLFSFYQRFIIERKMNPFGYGVEIPEFNDKKLWWKLKEQNACDIQDMVNLMNIDGSQLYEWMLSEIENGNLAFRDKLQLASYLELPLNQIGKIYNLSFWPWGKF